MDAMTELPAWLAVSPRPRPAPLPVPAGAQDQPRLQAAAKAAVEGELGKLEQHPSEAGTGRHTALYAAAAALGHHVASGGLARSEAETVLWEGAAWLALAHDGETWHQIEHGLADGETEPYVLRERPKPTAAPNGNGKAPPVEEKPTKRAVQLHAMAELTMRPVHWLWDERVPLGKLTVLAGLAGQGKSLLSCWLAAQASNGLLPGALEERPTKVLLVSAEDDPEDTIMPRLVRCGADLDRIYTMSLLEDGHPRIVLLPEDVDAITAALHATRAQLIVLDPISALLGTGLSAYVNQDVRRALGPLKQLVERFQCAAVLIQHLLPKSSGTDALQRLADSHAFSGLPRSVLVFGPDAEDDQGDRGSSKTLHVAKSNLAGRGEHGLRFTITDSASVSDGRGGSGMSAGIQLEGPCESSSADSLSNPEERGALREACDFLRAELADGPQQAGVMQRAAEAEGIALKTLRRAREKVCKRPYKTGPGPWYWQLKPTPPPDGHLGHDGHLPEPRRDQEGAQGGQGAQGGPVVQLFPDDPDPEETGEEDE